MTVTYESKRYPALGFYVDGAFKRFSNGVYVTEDVAEIAVLDAMSDVTRVSEAETDAESGPGIPQETPEVKPAPKRKPSAK
ncbi:hypothetical protein [Paenibacillus sp. YN15]|uniref:hypothetical protein n=1 Tax=Paenibacillus sp. YN15 TaxID=1742774 RepID=UPI000DCF4027|nr:hypothetical protein [Paenibacillus sp. YN15]RAU96835.1 hypothetical protein DQG13_19980 [Paenibacillus sp. YN15]